MAVLYAGVGFIFYIAAMILGISPSDNIEIPDLYAWLFIISFVIIFLISSLVGGSRYEELYGAL